MITMLATARRVSPPAATGIRFVSRGALSGGFSKGALQNWATNHWKEKSSQKPYVDLYNQRITKECASWLDSHPHPSSELAKAFFGSIRFVPERCVLTPTNYQQSRLLDEFTMGTKFLQWTVVSDTPHEMILTWSAGSIRGCTSVAFDPSLRRVYHGNCLNSKANSSSLVQALIPLHQAYAQFLLVGMMDKLEGQVAS